MNKETNKDVSRAYAQRACAKYIPGAEKLNVLIACEESQRECSAFRALGVNAFSCDIQPCRKGGNYDWHILGDVTPFLHGKNEFFTMDGVYHVVDKWHMIIAHPPCTYLCRCGSVWLYKNPDRYGIFDGKRKKFN